MRRQRWDRELARQRKGRRIVSVHEACPDCGGLDEHQHDCRRRGLAVDVGLRKYDELLPRAFLQFGPPWYEWEDGA